MFTRSRDKIKLDKSRKYIFDNVRKRERNVRETPWCIYRDTQTHDARDILRFSLNVAYLVPCSRAVKTDSTTLPQCALETRRLPDPRSPQFYSDPFTGPITCWGAGFYSKQNCELEMRMGVCEYKMIYSQSRMEMYEYIFLITWTVPFLILYACTLFGCTLVTKQPANARVDHGRCLDKASFG